jgi:gliding motility-associated-like protein
MTITTYTKASSTAADRDSLDVAWGDGTKEFVRRDNNRTRFEPNDIKINYYIARHTYPGVATYTVSFLDPNRIGGILNVNYPNSIDIPFFLSTTFTLLDQQFQGFNNSAILLQPPIDIGCVNKVFTHNPNAYDADGDSLAYELTPPLEGLGISVPGYKYPNEVGQISGNDFSINAITGEVVWNSPKLQGEYNIAIKIKEYRNGRLINVIIRDMQILIRACENEPPKIESIEELCVIAGALIRIPIKVTDPNNNQKVRITATGGPLTITNPAIFNGPRFFTKVPFETEISWQTDCNHISDQYYQFVLRAVDNFYPDSTGLATLKTIRIKIVGPAPQALTSISDQKSVKLEWNSPYDCEITRDQYFLGFSVWRKISSTNFMPDSCNPGLTGSPYQKIAFRTIQKDNIKYFYLDNNVEKGKTYCYRVQAEFAKKTSTGNPFNLVEGLASNETCIVLSRDVPLLTKTSVLTTDASQGSIRIKWIKPLAEQLDTIANPGPYLYEIIRYTSPQAFIKIGEILSPFFASPIPTEFVDNNINTVNSPFTYQVQLRSQGIETGKSEAASSIFLSIKPSDKKNTLTWASNTPWANISYKVYRKNVGGVFEWIGEASQPTYEDKGLINGQIYCYKIESIGTYNIQDIEDPILNDSQEACSIPIDDVPPCPLKISVENVCDRLQSEISSDKLYNTIKWTNPFLSCPDIADDIAAYRIYYAENVSSDLVFLDEIDAKGELSYIHYPDNGLLGCYTVTSVDKLGNESLPSNKFCVDNCPLYVLPNTFTPNGDGSNDFFKPRVNLFIEKIQFQVYNQWGNLVFETSDPVINWDGTTKAGQPLADGTYHYSCKVFEKRVSGISESKNVLTGYIHIIKN